MLNFGRRESDLPKSHGHYTNDCIQLKDAIKEMIKRGRLTEYMKGGKRDIEESTRGKSPIKTTVARDILVMFYVPQSYQMLFLSQLLFLCLYH